MKKYIINKKQLEVAVKKSLTFKDVLKNLNWGNNGTSNRRVKEYIEKYNIDTTHFTPKGQRFKNIKLSVNEDLMLIIKNSCNYSEVLRTLNIKVTGGAISSLKRFLLREQIDTSHFVKYRSKSKFIDEYLKIYTNSPLPKSSFVKNKLIYYKYKENQCESCGIIEWNNEPLVLQLHHIDGNKNNFLLNNLQVLCPNCHSQTRNWGNKKRIIDG